MDFLISAISLFWFSRTIQFVLFWIYLWQLKEYHVGRFLDHFKTYKGKKLLFGPLFLLKIILLLLLLTSNNFSDLFLYILLSMYTVEFLIFVVSIARKTLKKPAVTMKSLFLISLSLILAALFLLKVYNLKENLSFALSILLFDVFTPLIISFSVLFFQPFFVFFRNNILKKAKSKISQFKNLTVIGITGSYGKTSTKEFLTTILSSKYNVLSTPEHKNSEIGIAQTILDDLNENHRIFIVEMGAYNKGGIQLLCDIVKPKIGIITGVNEQHLSTFGSLENLLSAEGGKELVENLPNNGLIVVNGDNAHCLDLYKKIYKYKGMYLKKKIYTLQRKKIDSDIWTEDITVEKNYISFIARSREKEMIHFTVNVLGKQNVQNLLGAILVAKELGMSMEEISLACKNIKQEQAGITLKVGIHGINIIDSSYSSNPDGVVADLDYLAVFGGHPSHEASAGRSKKVVVMPCLIELGAKSAEIHYQIGKKIAEVCDLAIITSRDQFEEIKSGLLSADKKPQLIFSENPKEIFNLITTMCKEGDAVLLEGRVPGELIKLLEK